MKILVVDDSATMRRIVLRSLKDMGHEDCEEAENGAKALEAVERGGFGLVITDWNMPVMSGLEFVTALRAANFDLPVLMVTTNGSSVDVIDALKAGVTDYVVKPFSPDTLKDKVLSLLADD